MPEKFGVPTEEQLAKINKFAKRTLSADEVFVFPSKLIGDMIIPDRYIQLTVDVLKDFLQDVKAGVSLLLDHSWRADGFLGLGGRPKAAIPYGRTFDGRLETSNVEGETTALMGDTYIVRGIELDKVSTNDLIQSIEAGTLFDSSIGFSYNKGICSICGNDYSNYDKCNHIAGKTYEIEENGVTKNKLCYIQAQSPASLWENSLVFDGAYPTAGVLSKTGDILENDSGKYQVITELKEIDTSIPIIATYSERSGLITMVKKSEHNKQFSIYSSNTQLSDKKVDSISNIILKGDEKQMNEETLKMLETFGIAFKEGETKLEDVLSQVTEKWDNTIQEVKDSFEKSNGSNQVEEYMTKEQATEKLGQEYSSNKVLEYAKEGIEYHNEVVDEALKMGVRAMGNGFTSDTWKNTFSTMSTKAVIDIATTWAKQANEEIPFGRHTDPKADGETQKISAPDEAFKV